jgi:hypothetical protein
MEDNFDKIGETGAFWSISEYNSELGKERQINNRLKNVILSYSQKRQGSSVRCIKDNEEIITGIKLGNLEVFKNDIGEFSYFEALSECAKIGGGWRVPTKEELNQLFENKETIGHFTDGFYCSSTKADDEATGCSWGQRFSDGRPNIYSRSHKTFVRPVRGI